MSLEDSQVSKQWVQWISLWFCKLSMKGVQVVHNIHTIFLCKHIKNIVCTGGLPWLSKIVSCTVSIGHQ